MNAPTDYAALCNRIRAAEARLFAAFNDSVMVEYSDGVCVCSRSKIPVIEAALSDLTKAVADLSNAPLTDKERP